MAGQRCYANDDRQDGGKTGMHMVMMVIADRSRLASIIGANLRAIVGMVVAVLVAVMPEVCSMARRVFQYITNAH
ncbi:MAG: hypothetical protein A3J49_03940 [Gallionellales bacterium RIFCSPHIGHO2_02_FULL_57_16]|nr:MAG: hypothetical protein A3J49_03940 [Gallionellales bacterium RIFCSPHIGHO2_02_FULL_57_16]